MLLLILLLLVSRLHGRCINSLVWEGKGGAMRSGERGLFAIPRGLGTGFLGGTSPMFARSPMHTTDPRTVRTTRTSHSVFFSFDDTRIYSHFTLVGFFFFSFPPFDLGFGSGCCFVLLPSVGLALSVYLSLGLAGWLAVDFVSFAFALAGLFFGILRIGTLSAALLRVPRLRTFGFRIFWAWAWKFLRGGSYCCRVSGPWLAFGWFLCGADDFVPYVR